MLFLRHHQGSIAGKLWDSYGFVVQVIVLAESQRIPHGSQT
jgi:hypothetical protein